MLHHNILFLSWNSFSLISQLGFLQILWCREQFESLLSGSSKHDGCLRCNCVSVCVIFRSDHWVSPERQPLSGIFETAWGPISSQTILWQKDFACFCSFCVRAMERFNKRPSKSGISPPLNLSIRSLHPSLNKCSIWGHVRYILPFITGHYWGRYGFIERIITLSIIC